MEMNVSSTNKAYSSVAKAYEGYEIDKSAVARIKEQAAEAAKTKTGRPSAEFLKEQAAIFERPEVKEFLSQFHREKVYKQDNYGQSLFLDYQDSHGYGVRNNQNENLRLMSTADRGEYYKKAYAEIYDEIEKGYADGTRTRTFVDGEGNRRLATKEEELAALDKQYEEITRRLTAERSREVDKELIAQGKKQAAQHSYNQRNEAMMAAYKATHPDPEVSGDVKEFAKNVTASNVDELETKKMDFINMFSQRMLDFSVLLKQSYSQAQPGSFDVSAFLATVAQR